MCYLLFALVIGVIHLVAHSKVPDFGFFGRCSDFSSKVSKYGLEVLEVGFAAYFRLVSLLKSITPTTAPSETILLGIDPGTMVMGYGLIKIVGQAQPTLIAYDAVVMRTLPNQVMKLKHIFETVLGLIDTYHPDEMAIEAPFFGKNVQSMLKLGRAQGVAMAAAMAREVPVVEYMPKLVKRSVTGNGNASKEQVAAMLGSLLKLDQSVSPKLFDATDGLAVAMCHYFQTSGAVIKTTRTSKSATGKGAKGWAAFLADNPDRVKQS